jgi:Ca2+:H+ antiporter
MCYLLFQLFSHKNLYEDNISEAMKPKTVQYAPHLARRLHIPTQPGPASSSPPPGSDPAYSGNYPPDVSSVEAGLMMFRLEDEPQMSVPTTIGLLVVITTVCR